MVVILRWAVGGALLLLFACVASLNASILWIWYVQKRNAPSRIPLVGGLSGAIGVWVVPVAAAHKWWWVPPVVDLGCLLAIVQLVVYQLVDRRRQ